MNSITNVVRVKYGENDEPEPVFACPVVVDPTIQERTDGNTPFPRWSLGSALANRRRHNCDRLAKSTGKFRLGEQLSLHKWAAPFYRHRSRIGLN